MKYSIVKHKIISQKLKSLCTFLTILLLLPYVMTIFFHGADEKENVQKEIYVKVMRESGEAEKDENVIVEVPWEEYLAGMLALEIPKNSEPEFVKAQTVLTRTKLYQQVEEGKEPVFTERILSADELGKKWDGKGYEEYLKCLETAISDTENQVLFYGETYAWTPFHKSSNGMTRNAQEVFDSSDYPYLASRECPLDKEAEDEMEIMSYEYQEVQAECQPFLVAVDAEESEKKYQFEDFEILSYDSAGYVKEMRIGETICTGDQFRDALSLPSSCFSLQDHEGKLKVTTTGNGHGLGMSQWTANAMAKEGKTYEEILQFFFEGTELREKNIFY